MKPWTFVSGDDVTILCNGRVINSGSICLGRDPNEPHRPVGGARDLILHCTVHGTMQLPLRDLYTWGFAVIPRRKLSPACLGETVADSIRE